MHAEQLIVFGVAALGVIVYILVARLRGVAFNPVFAAEAGLTAGTAASAAFLGFCAIAQEYLVYAIHLSDRDGKPVHASEGYSLSMDLLHSFDVLVGTGMAIYLLSGVYLRACRHAGH